jgi:predicted PurR-regulated permease PerM
MSTIPLPKAIQVLFFFFLVFAGLYFAKPFLVPVAFAGLLSMLFLPISRRLERRGLNRGVATLLCILILLAVVAAIVTLLVWQVTDLASDAGQMEQRLTQMVSQLKQSITKSLGISSEQQKQLFEQQGQGSGGAGKMVTGFIGSIMSFLVDALLTVVYIFLFMYYRRHLKTFILKLVPEAEKRNAQGIIHDTQEVAQQYLGGLGMMIACLWIMYGIGFSIIGVKNAIFFAILCGLLEIVPFVGNLTGNALTVLMVITQGGGMNMVIGVLITYAIVQFLQTYILEPLVVGAEVNINPLFTILVIVLGELVWGVAGMVLAIPLLGIVKILCDHIEPLKPYGFLIGENKKKKKSGFVEKVKGWFK